MMLEEQRSCHLHTTILSKYVFWWKTECRVFSNFVSCSDQRKIGIVKFNKLLHNSFVLLTAALVWHQRNTSTHNYFSNACLIIVTTLGVFGLVIFLQLMSAIKSAHELWSNLHNDSSPRKLSVCHGESYYHIAVVPASFSPLQTISCCLASLALQMAPKARTAMAAAEEIGQN